METHSPNHAFLKGPTSLVLSACCTTSTCSRGVLEKLYSERHLFSQYNGEVARLCVQMGQMKDKLLSFFNGHSDVNEIGENAPDSPITLDDVLPHSVHSDFSLLSKCVLAVRAINPTTVSCERSFSSLIHSKHVNTKIEKLCSVVGYRLSITCFEEKGTDQSDGSAK